MLLVLNTGHTMQIDAEDISILDGCRIGVYDSGYAMARCQGVIAPVSRLIVGLTKGDKRQVDHINHDVLDNRRKNLRVVSQFQNQWNLRAKSTNTSGYKGVSWNANKKKWQATITVKGKVWWLGYFTDVKVAGAAYMAAAKLHHGEYACS